MSQAISGFDAPQFDKMGALISPRKPAFVAAADSVVGATVLTVDQIRQGSHDQEVEGEQDNIQDAPELQEYTEESVDSGLLIEGSEPETEVSVVEARQRPKAPMASKETNLRRLREDRDRVQQERDSMARELEMMRRVQPQQMYNQQQSAQQTHETDSEIDIDFGDDDLIEGKQLKKIVSSLNNKFKQNSYRSAQEVARAQEASIELQLRAKYPDFDSVVNNANLKDLEAAYPEIAASLHSTPSLYNKAVSAYTMIKNLGIHEEQVEEETHMAEKQKVRRNAVKPRPANANTQTHQSPLSQAGSFAELTPELMAQMRKEMASARKRL